MSLNFGNNVLVVGAGPVGAMIGSPLVKAGYNVTFAGRPGSSHTDHICKYGLKICYPYGNVFTISPHLKNVKFTDTFNIEGRGFDLIIIAVKSNHLLDVLSCIRYHSSRDSILVHAQNGIPYWWFHDNEYVSHLDTKILDRIQKGRYLSCTDPSGKILELLGDRHLMGCVVKAPSSKIKSGYVDIKKTPKILLGLTNQTNDKADLRSLSEFCVQLTQNGLLSQNTSNIRAEICKKLAVNLTTNTLAALTSRNTADLTNNPLSKTLIVDMLEEANKIFKMFNIDEQDLATQQELFSYLEDPGSQKHLPSLAQDFCKHQAGEINVIDAPVEMARIAGLRVPILESVSALLKAGQDYALRKDFDSNLLQLDFKTAKFTLNPNVFQTSTLRKFKLTDLLAHVDRLNQNSMACRAYV